MNSIVKTLIMLLLAGISVQHVFAQSEDEKAEVEYSNEGRGWTFGLNIGYYFTSKTTAAYYNGQSYNVNNVNFVMDNYYWYEEIFYAMGAHDSVLVGGLPENMRYQPAMQPGLYAQYCFNPRLALIIEFNYMRLKANDVITFIVDPSPYPTDKNPPRLYPIRGIEERVYADIGLKRTYPKNEKYSYFVMGGLNVNSTTVRKSSFYVGEKEYSMINNYGNGNYVPGGNNQTFSVYQGGIGIGMFAGGGASFTFGSIVLEPGITAHWLMVNLERYKSMNPGIGVYVRFLF